MDAFVGAAGPVCGAACALHPTAETSAAAAVHPVITRLVLEGIAAAPFEVDRGEVRGR
jgi:hypothetical protein